MLPIHSRLLRRRFVAQIAILLFFVGGILLIPSPLQAQPSQTVTNNVRPKAIGQTLVANGPIHITLSADDGDSDPVGDFTILSDPPLGTVSCDRAEVLYTPTPGFSGLDSFTFVASDWQGPGTPATIVINVGRSAEDILRADRDTFEANEDSTFHLDAPGVLDNDTASQGHNLRARIVRPPFHGQFSLDSDGGFTYTPVSNFTGYDSFTYQAVDTVSDDWAETTVVLHINNVNDAPIAQDGSFETWKGVAVQTPLSATDIDSDNLQFEVVVKPTHGTLSGNGAALTYTPEAGYSGPDFFTFKASDQTLASNTSKISLVVSPEPLKEPLDLAIMGVEPMVDVPYDWTGVDVINETSNGQTLGFNTYAGYNAVFKVRLKNTGTGERSFKLKLPAAAAGWEAHLFDAETGGNDITRAALGQDGWPTPTLAPFKSVVLRLEMVTTKIESEPYKFKVRGSSDSTTDQVSLLFNVQGLKKLQWSRDGVIWKDFSEAPNIQVSDTVGFHTVPTNSKIDWMTLPGVQPRWMAQNYWNVGNEDWVQFTKVQKETVTAECGNKLSVEVTVGPRQVEHKRQAEPPQSPVATPPDVTSPDLIED